MARTRTPRAPLVPPRREAPAGTVAGATPARPTPYRREDTPREPTGPGPRTADDVSVTTALPRADPAAPPRAGGAPAPSAAVRSADGVEGRDTTGPSSGAEGAGPPRPGAPEPSRTRRRGLLAPPGAATRTDQGIPGSSGASGSSGAEDTVRTRPHTGAGPVPDAPDHGGAVPPVPPVPPVPTGGTGKPVGVEPRAGAHRTATPTWLPVSARADTPVPTAVPTAGRDDERAPAAGPASTPVGVDGPSAGAGAAPAPGAPAPSRPVPPSRPPTAPPAVSPGTSALPRVPAAPATRPAGPDRAPVAPLRPAPPAGRPAPAAAPPRVDRNGPLREIGASLRRRRAPVAGAVLLAAAGAAGLAALFPPPTVATTSVQVGSVGTADPGPATTRALAAAGSAAFTDRVAELTGTGVTDVAGRLVLTAPEPGVVAVRATGTDDAAASALAADAVTALRERIGALDAAVTTGGTQPLRAEIDRRAAQAQAEGTGNSGGTATDPVADQLGRTLADRTGQVTVVVDGPEPVAAPEVPAAQWAGGAAGIGGGVALLLAALGVPAVRRGRGLLPEAHPEDRLRARLDIPVLAPGSAPDAVPRLAGAYRDLLRGAERLTVVQLTREPACDVASELVKAAALVGDRCGYRDLTPGAPATTVAPGVPVVQALRVPRLAHEDLRGLRDGGPSVLAVETAGTTAEDVATAVAALRAVGAPPLLCLVWPGRLSRDPARVPLPVDARTRSPHP
ncbi:hypothetical protein [Pseudonocardia sp. ICBG1293]|uniref:hypothetical protein n=1 Tax=Pseudonocardia sp. ICBG1293 TaxID=2844382 RepID=UPI001CCED091|nr:hypothetical protein [Pseudonocardia sp. ICBG1293]